MGTVTLLLLGIAYGIRFITLDHDFLPNITYDHEPLKQHTVPLLVHRRDRALLLQLGGRSDEIVPAETVPSQRRRVYRARFRIP